DLGGKILAGIRGAGLDDHRLALRAPLDVERAMYGEIFAVVIEGMLLVGKEAQARLAIINPRAILPSVPERVDDREKLARLRVAVAMWRQALEAEVARRIVIGRGHDIPGSAAVRDMIERGELAGEVVGLEKAGGGCRAETNMGGGAGNRRQQRDRLQHVHEQRRAAPGFEIFGARRRRVSDAEEVEFATLAKLRRGAVVVDVDRCMR